MKEVLLMIKVLLLMLLLCLIGIFLSGCRSHKESVQVQAEASQSEHVERVSLGQSIFALFDSFNATHSIEADSLELEIFALENPSVDKDSLTATRPPQSQAPGRLAARLRVKGIRANTQTTHTQVATSESLAVDADSVHRISQEELDESIHEEKVVKPPNTLRNLSVLLGLAFICFIIWKIKR